MPNIDLIPEVFYESFHPYHYLFDNMPLYNILARISMVNDTVDLDHIALRDAIGTAGSLATRLDTSLNDDGTLKSAAIDTANHGIEHHTDETDQSGFLLVGDTFVRMTERERAKLETVQDDANSIILNFETASPSNTPVDFTNGTIVFADSVSTAWRWQAGKIYLDLAFPVAAAHLHTYDTDPTNPTGDFRTYYVPVTYLDGSLRVYVNGIRLNEDDAIYHPGAIPTTAWVLNKYTVDTINPKKFTLDNPLTANDIIKIDFDQSYT